VDNNDLDLGMSKSGFIHTLPSGRLNNTLCEIFYSLWDGGSISMVLFKRIWRVAVVVFELPSPPPISHIS
jgi:hypothetical protein